MRRVAHRDRDSPAPTGKRFPFACGTSASASPSARNDSGIMSGRTPCLANSRAPGPVADHSHAADPTTARASRPICAIRAKHRRHSIHAGVHPPNRSPIHGLHRHERQFANEASSGPVSSTSAIRIVGSATVSPPNRATRVFDFFQLRFRASEADSQSQQRFGRRQPTNVLGQCHARTQHDQRRRMQAGVTHSIRNVGKCPRALRVGRARFARQITATGVSGVSRLTPARGRDRPDPVQSHVETPAFRETPPGPRNRERTPAWRGPRDR